MKEILKDKTPFKVPDGYFEDLANRVVKKVEHDEVKDNLKIMPMLKSFMWLVASFLFIFTLGRLIVPYFADPAEKLSSNISLNIETGSTFDFTDGFDPSVDDIIEYLSEEDIDMDLLMAEL